jgi:hypothetical protein
VVARVAWNFPHGDSQVTTATKVTKVTLGVPMREIPVQSLPRPKRRVDLLVSAHYSYPV